MRIMPSMVVLQYKIQNYESAITLFIFVYEKLYRQVYYIQIAVILILLFCETYTNFPCARDIARAF